MSVVPARPRAGEFASSPLSPLWPDLSVPVSAGTRLPQGFMPLRPRAGEFAPGTPLSPHRPDLPVPGRIGFFYLPTTAARTGGRPRLNGCHIHTPRLAV